MKNKIIMMSEAREQKTRITPSEAKAEKAYRAEQKKEKEVKVWLTRNPEVGLLASGKCYINTNDGIEYVTPETYGK